MRPSLWRPHYALHIVRPSHVCLSHVQCSHFHGQTSGVTSLATFRSQCQRSRSQEAKMWIVWRIGPIFPKNASIHVKPIWWPQYSSENVRTCWDHRATIFAVVSGNLLRHTRRVGTHSPSHHCADVRTYVTFNNTTLQGGGAYCVGVGRM